MNVHEERACENFTKGYNCAQAVSAAFAEEMQMTEKQAARLSSAFGGGMGRMREVCGAVSAMCMVLGVLYGYDEPEDKVKKELYEKVQSLAEEFKREHKTIICRELLGTDGSQSSVPTPRTPDFYKSRPCLSFVKSAARILARYIKSNPV